MKSKLKQNIWKTYLFMIFMGTLFSVPVMVLFWQDNGLSITEIMILQSLFAIAVVLLEVPTGYFADIFGRKKSLILSGLFWFTAMLIYSLGHNFYQFLIGEMFCAFAISLLSGADSALVFDTLVDMKREKEYKKIWGTVISISFISMAVSNIIGGFVGEINLRLTLYATLPFAFLAAPVALTIKEPKRHKTIIKKGYVFELFKILKYALITNTKIRWLIIYSGIIVGFNQAALWLYQPYFKLSGLDIFYFGFVFASFNVIAALSSRYAHKIEQRLGRRYSLIMLVVLLGISYLLMSNFVFLFSFSFAFLHQFIRGFIKPILSDYINKLTESNIRATVLSVQNMFGRMFYAFVIPFIGWIADVYTLTQALTVLGIMSFVFGIVILVVLHKAKIYA